MNGEEVITLNVGGSTFKTYRSTLLKYPDTLLGTMFSERNTEMRRSSIIDASYYFFDRCHVAFADILNFYRTGVLCSARVSPALFKLELAFWQIPIAALSAGGNSSLGESLRIKSMSACETHYGASISKVVDAVVVSCERAAHHGCAMVKVDFLIGTSYLRSESGVDADNVTVFHFNVVDPEVVQFLRQEHSGVLVLRRLRSLGLHSDFKRIGIENTNFCLTVDLWAEDEHM